MIPEGARTQGDSTMILTFDVLASWPSLAESCNTYAPAAGNVTAPTGDVALLNDTVPGPLSCVHLEVRTPPTGSPSSLTTPFNVALLAGGTISCGGPASTNGGALPDDVHCSVTMFETLPSPMILADA